ncbi:MAG: nitroreductase family protein [Deltaproteobacteria bacterium]|nr:nitroreductase family protein [Deltaproteobacteria bacterium]
MNNPIVDLLNKRHASRAIDTKPLAEKVVAEMAEAVRLTPSCYNKQPWRFLFLTSKEGLEKGRQALTGPNLKWASTAPLLIVGYSRKEDDCVLNDGRAYHEFDLGMSAMNLMLSATHHDLVARPMAGFDPTKVRELFGLSPEEEPLVMIAVGNKASDDSHVPDSYKQIAQQPRSRKPVEEIIKRL